MYITTVNGDCVVIVTSVACSDRSDCNTVNLVIGVEEATKSIDEINVYPNPTTRNACVDLSGVGKTEILIADLTGERLYYKNNITSTKEELPMVDFVKGIISC